MGAHMSSLQLCSLLFVLIQLRVPSLNLNPMLHILSGMLTMLTLDQESAGTQMTP